MIDDQYGDTHTEDNYCKHVAYNKDDKHVANKYYKYDLNLCFYDGDVLIYHKI